MAQVWRGACGKVRYERRLNVDPPPTFANRECRRQHRVACAITARPCGCRGAEYKRQEIISFSTFCRNNAKFQHQRYVAKSARGAIGRVKRVGRYSSQQLGSRTRDELKALAAAKLVRSISLG